MQVDDHPLERVRRDCARVADAATHVAVDHDRLQAYAAALTTVADAGSVDPGRMVLGDVETTAGFVVSLDAINFGSGWFPHLVKRPGMSGYHTVAAAWRKRWTRDPVAAGDLVDLDADDCVALFGQHDADEEAHELMGLFATALGDLGTLLIERYDGSYTALVEAAGHHASRMVSLLTEMPFYDDVAHHDGEPVALYKRAQITPFDLHRALGPAGPGRFDDIDELTMFADNLVPHVLRLDGVLVVDDGLVSRIEAGELIESGSAPEVELRACAVHAVERIVAATREAGSPLNAATVDGILWERGGGARYKAVPRHRTRCVFY